MIEKKQIEKSTAEKWNWFFIAKSYLALAYIGIKEIKEKKYCKKPNFLWRISGQIYDGKLLLVPVLWNLKHGIEIILKSLNISINSEYMSGHDLPKLEKYLQASLKKLGINEITYINELSELINKYYRCEFWNKKLVGIQNIEDSKNDFLRYPERFSGLALNFKKFKTVSETDVDELLSDIELLNLRLTIIDAQIQLGQTH